jgi:O-antigen/teichoic acid export membrane protein
LSAAAGAVRRRLTRDGVLAGSTAMLANTAILAGFGYVFSVIAARDYSVSAVGDYVAFNSGASLLGMLAGLGWSVSFIRFLPRDRQPRMLILLMTVSIILIGGGIVVGIESALGKSTLQALHLAPANAGLLFTALVVLTALGSVTTPALVSQGAWRGLIITDLFGSIVRVAMLPPLISLGVSGLLIAYTGGTAAGLVAAWVWMWKTAPAIGRRPVRVGEWWPDLSSRLRSYYRYAGMSYVTAIVSVAPIACVPLIVGATLGSRQLAWYGMAASVGALLTVIPSTVSQAYLVNTNKDEASAGRGALSALKVIYALLIPAALVVCLAAPLVLAALGKGYAAHGVSVARVLVLNAFLVTLCYVIEASLAGTGRMRAYVGLNVFNALFVIGMVLLVAHGGLISVVLGLMIGNAGTVTLGTILLVWHRQQSQKAVASNQLLEGA